jgi:hypothetical protein
VLHRIRATLGTGGARRATATAPSKNLVVFDGDDGARRVLIEVTPDGTFAPIRWYGVPGGELEASVIAAHGAFILAEAICHRAFAPAAPSGEAANGD